MESKCARQICTYARKNTNKKITSLFFVAVTIVGAVLIMPVSAYYNNGARSPRWDFTNSRWNYGLFPNEYMGGIHMIRALCGYYRTVYSVQGTATLTTLNDGSGRRILGPANDAQNSTGAMVAVIKDMKLRQDSYHWVAQMQAYLDQNNDVYVKGTICDNITINTYTSKVGTHLEYWAHYRDSSDSTFSTATGHEFPVQLAVMETCNGTQKGWWNFYYKLWNQQSQTWGSWTYMWSYKFLVNQWTDSNGYWLGAQSMIEVYTMGQVNPINNYVNTDKLMVAITDNHYSELDDGQTYQFWSTITTQSTPENTIYDWGIFHNLGTMCSWGEEYKHTTELVYRAGQNNYDYYNCVPDYLWTQ